MSSPKRLIVLDYSIHFVHELTMNSTQASSATPNL